MYAKVNGAKVIYDGDAQNLKEARWQMWYRPRLFFGPEARAQGHLSKTAEGTAGQLGRSLPGFPS